MKKARIVISLVFVLLILVGCSSPERKVRGTWEMKMEDGTACAYFYEDGTMLFETGEIISYGGEDGGIGVAERVGYYGHYYEENENIVGYVEEMGDFTVYIIGDGSMMDLVFNEDDNPLVYTLTKE